MTKLVTILGGSGFVGRYVARRMAQAGWRVRVATRRPNERLYVRTYGAVGQVEPVLCNIRDAASLRAAIRGASAVINCAGILAEKKRNTFAAVQAEGAGLAARIAAEEGVGRFVHISAIGADPQAESAYGRSKAAGEAAVTAAFPAAVILRPSIIFGPEDRFFNRFAALARLTPVVPLFGANTRFQPVHVDDVARAAAEAAMRDIPAGVYELGGPDVATFRELVVQMLGLIRRRRAVAGLPWFAGRIMAGVFDLVETVTGGLVPNPVITRDQLKSLRADNVVAEGARGFKELGIQPVPMALVLPTYLWPYRPAGQFAAIRESAEGLRGH